MIASISIDQAAGWVLISLGIIVGLIGLGLAIAALFRTDKRPLYGNIPIFEVGIILMLISAVVGSAGYTIL